MTVTPVRLGAVGYLNARPLVYGLERAPRFDLRFDVPSECARLLHAHEIDLGLIPSIEYLRGPRTYEIAPGPAVVSHGAVASVAIYTRRDPKDIRTIAMDTSSRTSVALATIVLKHQYEVTPAPIPLPPDLESMLAQADAALIIGDAALMLDHAAHGVEKIDLGEAWTRASGLPFVYAFWAGWPRAVMSEDAAALQQARDAGLARVDDVARQYYPGDPTKQGRASRYLRDNIQYFLGSQELEGLQTFYRYAAELGLVPASDGELRFYHADAAGADGQG